MTEAAPQPLALVVDENLMFAMMVEPQLRRLGHRVQTLSGGADLAHRIAAATPDLVLVNLTSERINGPELIRTLRGREETAATPIVGYAGHVERAYFAAGRDAGADLVVPNSAVRASLAEVLAKLAKRRAGEAVDEES